MSAARQRARTVRRRGAALLLCTAALFGVTLVATPAASAHPLGNATVNHYDGLLLYPDHIADLAVEDIAEIPTLQRKSLIDSDRNGALSAGELAAYAAAQCASLSAADTITVGHARLRLLVASAEYSQQPGAIGLSTGRLVCQLTAPANLSRAATVRIDDEWDGAGIGWHELTAVGRGVSLHSSPVPATSISNELRRYPNDLLSSPLDQRAAAIAVVPGANASTYSAAHGLPGSSTAARLLNDLNTAFNGMVGRRHLTVGIGLLAVLLAMVLGAGHAFLPGHGKTIMAAYLVGKRGRYRDVVMVGATVTLTHTIGVLVIGLALSLSASLAPTVVEQDLAVVSGLIVAGVGAWLLITALRRWVPAPTFRRWPKDRGRATAAMTTHRHPHQPVPALAHVGSSPGHAPAGVGPEHLEVHTEVVSGHIHPHDHHDDHGNHRHVPSGRLHHHVPEGGAERAEPTFSRRGLIGLGVAGGLVPSPSALLVLLAAVALGRTIFGIVLVLGYGVGMAMALTAAGLLLVRLRTGMTRLTHTRAVGRLMTALPVITACLVLIVGAGLVLSALAGTV